MSLELICPLFNIKIIGVGAILVFISLINLVLCFLLTIFIKLIKYLSNNINKEEYYLRYKDKSCKKVSWKCDTGINYGWYVDTDKILFYKYNIIYSEDLSKFLELNTKIELTYDNYDNIILRNLF